MQLIAVTVEVFVDILVTRHWTRTTCLQASGSVINVSIGRLLTVMM